ncbi:hypothetical protein [Nocardioides sp. TRM66260-LWL]|nr:hypothetical protein [Nocardioides sp. TRM66260-LWL]
MSALLIVLAVAAGARVAFELLAPLLPSLIVLVVLSFIFSLLFRR